MHETTTTQPQTAATSSRFDRFVSKYREEHRNPINSFLHLGVGWPLCAAAVILLPFHPFWSVGLVAVGYAFMFAGHFLFEGNTPTILKHPSTPFVIAWAVIRGLATKVILLAKGALGR
jgi:hypothetical protein